MNKPDNPLDELNAILYPASWHVTIVNRKMRVSNEQGLTVYSGSPEEVASWVWGWRAGFAWVCKTLSHGLKEDVWPEPANKFERAS